MTKCREPMDFKGIDDAVGSLVSAQIALGRELIKLAGDGCGAAMDGVRSLRMPRPQSCCSVPEPCWMPRDLGEICCQLRPGDEGELCLVISNEDFRSHDYQVTVTGEDAAHVAVSRSSFTLGPKARRSVRVTFRIPADEDEDRGAGCGCADHEALIWVQGCHNHYLRWSITAAERSRPCKHRVCVEDIPDYVLHWYDHFYINRPCFGPQTAPKG